MKELVFSQNCFTILTSRTKKDQLIQQVKIARSFLHVMSKLFHSIISVFLGKSTSDRKRIFIHSHFQLNMKVGLSIQLNCRPTLKTICFFFI